MKIQKYSTPLSSHIKGREKHVNRRSGRIHAGYSTFTETGRCNSFNPNGQNVPRLDNDEFGIRNFHVPDKGKVYFLIDFSGFESRLMAWKSGDEVMIDLFSNNGDMHKRTASVMTGKPESEIVKKSVLTQRQAISVLHMAGQSTHCKRPLKRNILSEKPLMNVQIS